MKHRHFFTMVEIMLALGVCAIGICSIMVLFPIGANASRDAAMETYAANTASQMLEVLNHAVTRESKYWKVIVKGDTESEFTVEADEIITFLQPPPGAPSDPPDPTAVGNDVEQPADIHNIALWELLKNDLANNVFKHKTKHGVYQVVILREDVEAGSSSNVDSDKIDFRLIMKVWKESVEISNSNTISDDIAIRFKVELSWPAQLPYEVRQKSYFDLDVFNTSGL